MKKLLLIGSALTLISTSAMASQARLLALGMKETDNEGMYHISDARNIFLNPAYVNVYNNYVTAEYGKEGLFVSKDTTGATSSDATLDRDTKPKAQGGFFKKQGDFVYGFYMGNESNTSSMLRIVGTSATAAINAAAGPSKMLKSADNQFDLFFGGGNDLKWGANATVAFGKDDARKAKDSALSLRSGLIGSNWDAHLNVSLASKSEAVDSVNLGGVTEVSHEFKGKLGFQVGGSYVFSGNNRVFGYIKHYGWEQKDSSTLAATTPIGGGNVLGGQKGTVKGDFTSVYLGWGSHEEVNGNGKVFYSLTAKKTDINAKFAKKGEVRNLVLPVTIGYEAVATEWLTLRGSVIHNVWGQRDNKNYNSINPVGRGVIKSTFGDEGKGSLPNSTEVNAGATLTFSKLSVDGFIGARNAADGKTSGSLRLDELMSRVAVTYNF